MLFQKIYEALLKHFGQPKYPEADSVFEICIRIILTQRANWSMVVKVTQKLKEKSLLTPEVLSECTEEELKEILKPLGLLKRRVETLKNFANYCWKKYGGNLEKWFHKNMEEVRKELLAIPGIGNETAEAIILAAGKKPIYPVDEYTRRIFKRIGIVKEKNDMLIRNVIRQEFGENPQKYQELRLLLIQLGQKYCRGRPKCEKCPLCRFCEFQHI